MKNVTIRKILSMYKENHSVEGIKNIFVFVEQYNISFKTILKVDDESHILNVMERKIMTQLCEEYQSFKYLEHICEIYREVEDPIADVLYNEEMQKFYEYLKTNNVRAFCGEKYLLINLINNLRKEKDYYENLRVEHTLRSSQIINLIVNYLNAGHDSKYISEILKNRYTKKDLLDMCLYLKTIDVNNKDSIRKIVRCTIKDIAYFIEIVESSNTGLLLESFKKPNIQILRDLKLYGNRYGLFNYDECLKAKKFYEARVDRSEERRLKNLDERRKVRNEYRQEECEKLITDYMNSGLAIDEYCNSLGITVSHFHDAVKVLNQLNSPLVEMYNNYVSERSTKKYVVMKNIVGKTVAHLRYGIDEDGKKRKFTILDYYKIVSCPLEEFLDMSKRVLDNDSYEYHLVFDFVEKYINNKTISFDKIYQERYFIDAEFDEDGRFIPGTGREVTKEEKKNIIFYLTINKIPVTSNTYGAALAMWRKNQLNIENGSEQPGMSGGKKQ